MLTEAEVIERVESRFKFQTPIKKSPPPHKLDSERYGDYGTYTMFGTRVWGFVTKQGRNRFAADYARHAIVTVPNAHARHRS